MVNDVSGGLADPGMLGLVAERAVPYVAMHWRGHSVHMQSRAVYNDVVADVCRELTGRRDAAVGAGVAPERIVAGPGPGLRQDRGAQLAPARPRSTTLRPLGHPRPRRARRARPSSAGSADPGAASRPPLERDEATAATSVLAARQACGACECTTSSRPARRPRRRRGARALAGRRRVSRPRSTLLRGLRGHGFHGVLAHERRDGQRVRRRRRPRGATCGGRARATTSRDTVNYGERRDASRGAYRGRRRTTSSSGSPSVIADDLRPMSASTRSR